jgi:nucleoside-diphosphate-sugar epimerase
MAKNICILGANGFIGRNLMKYYGNERAIGITRNILNLEDSFEVDKFFNEFSFDIVIHTVVSGGAITAGTDDPSCYDKNITTFKNVIKHVTKWKRFVWFSSGAALNNSDTPYGASKLECEKLALQIPNCQIWRIYNCYGDDELSRRFISICKNNKEVTIEQDRYFDFFNIKDLCILVDKYEITDNVIRDMVYEKKYLLSETAKLLGLSHDKIHIIKSGLGPSYIGKYDPIIAKYIKLT